MSATKYQEWVDNWRKQRELDRTVRLQVVAFALAMKTGLAEATGTDFTVSQGDPDPGPMAMEPDALVPRDGMFSFRYFFYLSTDGTHTRVSFWLRVKPLATADGQWELVVLNRSGQYKPGDTVDQWVRLAVNQIHHDIPRYIDAALLGRTAGALAFEDV